MAITDWEGETWGGKEMWRTKFKQVEERKGRMWESHSIIEARTGINQKDPWRDPLAIGSQDWGN